MPRLKPSKADARRAEVEGLIHRGLIQTGLTYTELAKRLGVSHVTFRGRRLSPTRFTVGEIQKMSRILGIPERDFVRCLFTLGEG